MQSFYSLLCVCVSRWNLTGSFRSSFLRWIRESSRCSRLQLDPFSSLRTRQRLPLSFPFRVITFALHCMRPKAKVQFDIRVWVKYNLSCVLSLSEANSSIHYPLTLHVIDGKQHVQSLISEKRAKRKLWAAFADNEMRWGHWSWLTHSSLYPCVGCCDGEREGISRFMRQETGGITYWLSMASSTVCSWWRL